MDDFYETEMTDIPNYLSLILSVVISIVIVVYQKNILDYFSRRNENKLVKRKDKALSLYRETQRLLHDQSYLMIKFAKMQLKIATSAVSIITSTCLSVYISSLESLRTICKIGKSVNVNCAELSQTNFSKTLLSIAPNFDFWFINFVTQTTLLILVQLSFTLFLIACSDLLNTVRRLEHFEEFELKLKRQWPDAFPLAASVEVRRPIKESSAPSLSEMSGRH